MDCGAEISVFMPIFNIYNLNPAVFRGFLPIVNQSRLQVVLAVVVISNRHGRWLASAASFPLMITDIYFLRTYGEDSVLGNTISLDLRITFNANFRAMQNLKQDYIPGVIKVVHQRTLYPGFL